MRRMGADSMTARQEPSSGELDDGSQVVGQLGPRGLGVEAAGAREDVGGRAAERLGLDAGLRVPVDAGAVAGEPHEADDPRAQPLGDAADADRAPRGTRRASAPWRRRSPASPGRSCRRGRRRASRQGSRAWVTSPASVAAGQKRLLAPGVPEAQVGAAQARVEAAHEHAHVGADEVRKGPGVRRADVQGAVDVRQVVDREPGAGEDGLEVGRDPTARRTARGSRRRAARPRAPPRSSSSRPACPVRARGGAGPARSGAARAGCARTSCATTHRRARRAGTGALRGRPARTAHRGSRRGPWRASRTRRRAGRAAPPDRARTARVRSRGRRAPRRARPRPPGPAPAVASGASDATPIRPRGLRRGGRCGYPRPVGCREPRGAPMTERSDSSRVALSAVLVVFGATGDLAHRKLFPALDRARRGATSSPSSSRSSASPAPR